MEKAKPYLNRIGQVLMAIGLFYLVVFGLTLVLGDARTRVLEAQFVGFLGFFASGAGIRFVFVGLLPWQRTPSE